MPARRGLLADAGEWRACVCGPPSLPYAQALFCRRRHQPSRRPPPNISAIRPGSPAPAMGPGTGTPTLAIAPGKLLNSLPMDMEVSNAGIAVVSRAVPAFAPPNSLLDISTANAPALAAF